MAKLKAVRNRGRKKGSLRIAATELASKVAAAPGPKADMTVEVAPKNGRKNPETIVVSLPKGTVAIPVALTSDKTEENAREQLRLAASDAGTSVSIRSATYSLDADADDVERVCWFYVPKAEKAAKATSKAKGKS